MFFQDGGCSEWVLILLCKKWRFSCGNINPDVTKTQQETYLVFIVCAGTAITFHNYFDQVELQNIMTRGSLGQQQRDSKNSQQPSGRRTVTPAAGNGRWNAGRNSTPFPSASRTEFEDAGISCDNLRKQWQEDLTKVMEMVENKINATEGSVENKTDSVTEKNDTSHPLMEEVKKHIEALDFKWSALFEEIERKLRETNDAQKELKIELERQEQYLRRSCLLIHGIEEKNNENSVQTAVNIINNSLDLQLTTSDLVTAHRLGRTSETNQGKPRPIIVKFLRMTDRDNVYKNKRKLKGTKIIITESLTRSRKDFLNKLQELNINCWTIYGEIYAINKKGRKIRVTPETNLSELKTVPKNVAKKEERPKD